MEMRKYLLLGLVCFISLIISAQDIAIDKQINALKLDTTLIYAEATMKSLRDAEEGANLLFEANVAEWTIKEFGEEYVEQVIENARRYRDEIQKPRGNYFRIFVYVKKDSIEVEHMRPLEVKEVKIMLNEEELEMVTLDSFYKIEPYIKLLENKGKLKAYGKFKNLPNNDLCYLFIYNKEGEIVAVMKHTADKVINLKTLEQDIVTNYKNCGAIWFQLK